MCFGTALIRELLYRTVFEQSKVKFCAVCKSGPINAFVKRHSVIFMTPF